MIHVATGLYIQKKLKPIVSLVAGKTLQTRKDEKMTQESTIKTLARLVGPLMDCGVISQEEIDEVKELLKNKKSNILI